MFDELWSEIADAPGEIFDVIDFKEEWEKEEKFDVENYINGNTDYWYKLCSFSIYIYYWERQLRVDDPTTYTQNRHRGQNRVL